MKDVVKGNAGGTVNPDALAPGHADAKADAGGRW